MPRLTSFLAALALAAGCNSTVPVLRLIPDSQHGSFRFSDRISQASPTIIVEGEFTVQADTIIVGVSTGICQPIIPPSTQSYRYRCGQMTLSFDRRNPLQRASYSVEGTAMETVRVCLRYTTNPNGQTICAAYGQETQQVVRVFGGTIRPIPKSP
ncbi:MAG: hypothetical protein SGI84_13055 [Gemmatimonadota bacterium]|nr:hypothetical protein [Gemmatimonadota bacterium]